MGRACLLALGVVAILSRHLAWLALFVVVVGLLVTVFTHRSKLASLEDELLACRISTDDERVDYEQAVKTQQVARTWYIKEINRLKAAQEEHRKATDGILAAARAAARRDVVRGSLQKPPGLNERLRQWKNLMPK